ncbi:flagellar basal body P-ring formation chaperone FlgA [Massilia sp. CFBP9026]|uniref:flagellar basal body P-ring formation chaperone FlgA n=1 Tax=Massilia sp. CFBP9026 TaxID=3096536 RepID=UPI002A6A2324|nr:flagellar basal body P-ring formation chaperone FlgA [Massilia sp. CFBP9026]MDY0962692.1 flagellar basal body P-ring formation chaperone FlgA [Massilia sp. CFBP9026]
MCTTAEAAQTLSVEIEQAAREQLEKGADAVGLGDPQFDLTVSSSRPAPVCKGPVTVEAIDTRQPARMRFVARCPDGNGWRHDFVVRARISALVAVTAAPVAANRELSEADVTLERRDITQVRDPIGMLDEAVGQSSRRSLRAGEVLRASQLVAPIVVKRGEAVVMTARQDGIEVTMAGEALDAGARGAVVRVKNSASGQVVRMRVLGAGAVQPIDMPLGE